MFTPSNDLPTTSLQQVNKPTGSSIYSTKCEIHLTTKMMIEKEVKKKLIKKKKLNHESSIDDIIDMIKDTMRNLEKQSMTNEPHQIRDKIL